jgi:hypothetical protein
LRGPLNHRIVGDGRFPLVLHLAGTRISKVADAMLARLRSWDCIVVDDELLLSSLMVSVRPA